MQLQKITLSRLKAESYYDIYKSYEFIEGLKDYIQYHNNKWIITKLKMPPVQYREQCLSTIYLYILIPDLRVYYIYVVFLFNSRILTKMRKWIKKISTLLKIL